MPNMPTVLIRNLPEATHRALKRRASLHGRSTEAEIRSILEQAVNPPDRVRLGSELAAIGRQFGGVELKIERDQTPARTVRLE
jgi:plasmid stability protein